VRIVVTENVTLDGDIDAAGDWFQPSSPATDTSDQVAAIRQLMASEAAQLYGRLTFEAFRSFWPAQRDVDTTGISAHLDAVPKYVLSSTLERDPGWGATVVRSLDELPGGDDVLGLTGSISVVHELLRRAASTSSGSSCSPSCSVPAGGWCPTGFGSTCRSSRPRRAAPAWSCRRIGRRLLPTSGR